MNIKKAIVILIVFFTITGIIFEIVYFRIPHWIEAVTLPDMFEIISLFKRTLSILSIILTFIGVLKLIKIKKIELLNIFKLPIFLIFLDNFFRFIQSISSSEIQFFLFENAPWYLYIIRFLSLLFLVLVIIHYSKTTNPISKETIPVSMSSRFLNRLIDISILFIYGLETIQILSYVKDAKLEYFTQLNSSIYFLIITFCYYFIFEFLFLQTVGKLHNNSRVAYTGNRFTAILIRTLCRFIPFDALSFLGSKGWHDSISETTVISADSTNN